MIINQHLTKNQYMKKIFSIDTISVKVRFTYNGNSATCISSDIETTCPSPLREITNKSASKSLKKAIASATKKNI